MNTPQHMTSQREENARLADQAAEWLDALESGTASGEAFFVWLKQSPRHVQEVLLQVAITDSFATLSPKARQSFLAQLATDKADRPPAVIELNPAAVAPPGALRRIARPWFMATAASVLVTMLAGAWLLFGIVAPRSYETHIGEQRALELEDGSIVHLNTQSRLTVRYSKDTREIRLTEGEALFNIKPDPARPLTVLTPEAVIRVLGTQFNVYHRERGTKVSVLDGRVQISGSAATHEFSRDASTSRQLEGPTSVVPSPKTTTLAAGQEVDVAINGRIEVRPAIEIARAVAWRQRRLVFQKDSLADIAREFNRYNSRSAFAIEGRAAERRFSGTFDADSPETLARALADIASLEVKRHANQIVVRDRRDDPPHGTGRRTN